MTKRMTRRSFTRKGAVAIAGTSCWGAQACLPRNFLPIRSHRFARRTSTASWFLPRRRMRRHLIPRRWTIRSSSFITARFT